MAGPRAAVEAALQSMRAALPAGPVEALRNAAVRLSGLLSSGGSEAANAAMDSGCLELLVDAAHAHLGNAELQRWLLSVLGNVAERCGDAAAAAAVRAGAVAAVVAGLGAHPGSAEVQRWGLGALRSILEGAGKLGVTAMRAAGGGDVVAASLAQHHASNMVQCAGLAVMGCVALEVDDEGEEGKDPSFSALLGASGVQLASAALAEHAGNAEVEARALSALWALLEADSGSVAEAVQALLDGEGEGIDRMVRAMQGHLADCDVQRWGVAAIGALARAGGECAIPLMVIQGVVEAVASAMKQLPDVAEVQERGLGTLVAIATDGGKEKVQAIVDEGGLEAIQAAIRAHPDNQQVQSWGDAAMELVLEQLPKKTGVAGEEEEEPGSGASGGIGGGRGHRGDEANDEEEDDGADAASTASASTAVGEAKTEDDEEAATDGKAPTVAEVTVGALSDIDDVEL